MDDGRANPCAVVVRRWSEKEKHSPPRHKDAKGIITGRTGREGRKDFTTKAQRTQRGKDAGHKRKGHGGKRAVVRGLSVLDFGHP
jgi:hypothetical protein